MEQKGGGFHLGIANKALTPRHLDLLGVYANLQSCLRILNIGKRARREGTLSEHICMHNILCIEFLLRADRGEDFGLCQSQQNFKATKMIVVAIVSLWGKF